MLDWMENMVCLYNNQQHWEYKKLTQKKRTCIVRVVHDVVKVFEWFGAVWSLSIAFKVYSLYLDCCSIDQNNILRLSKVYLLANNHQ
jgi:hypothetical protein